MERGSLSCPHYILLQNILLRSEYFKGGQLHEQVQKVRGSWYNRVPSWKKNAMSDGLRTVVILSDERVKKDYRHVLGKVDEARIELEVLNSGNSLSEEWVEDVSRVRAHLFLVDLPRAPENGLGVMEQLPHQF